MNNKSIFFFINLLALLITSTLVYADIDDDTTTSIPNYTCNETNYCITGAASHFYQQNTKLQNTAITTKTWAEASTACQELTSKNNTYKNYYKSHLATITSTTERDLLLNAMSNKTSKWVKDKFNWIDGRLSTAGTTVTTTISPTATTVKTTTTTVTTIGKVTTAVVTTTTTVTSPPRPLPTTTTTIDAVTFNVNYTDNRESTTVIVKVKTGTPKATCYSAPIGTTGLSLFNCDTVKADKTIDALYLNGDDTTTDGKTINGKDEKQSASYICEIEKK